MKILNRYIGNTVVSAVLIVILILMGLEMLISFIDQLSDIGTGNYTLWEAVKFVMLDMPFQVYNFFPMAGLVGSLIGLGVLASQSELTVMRAAGFSNSQITLAVLKAAFILMLLAIIIGEGIAPKAEHIANVMRAVDKSGTAAINTVQGVWLREGHNFIYIQRVIDNDTIEDLMSYEFGNNNNLLRSLHARKGEYIHGHWYLYDVKQTVFKNNKTITQTKPKIKWSVKVDPELLSISSERPRNMMLPKLYLYIKYLKSNGLRPAKYQLNFWKRVFAPVAMMVMILLAVPFVFGSMRSVTMGMRILFGVSLGFLFYIVNQFIGPFSLIYQIPGIVAGSIPPLFFAVLGIVLLRRRR
ncbi:MAG: LPS export ABC transporter permease LptG [Pseudomonadota bacterium]